MDSYRIQLETTTNIALDQGEELDPIPTEMRGTKGEVEVDQLSNILKSFNERYGTEFEDTDKVRKMAEDIAEGVMKNEEIKNSLEYSDDQNAKITNDKVVAHEMLKHINFNFNFYKHYSDNKEFKEEVNSMIFGLVKDMLRKGFNGSTSI